MPTPHSTYGSHGALVESSSDIDLPRGCGVDSGSDRHPFKLRQCIVLVSAMPRCHFGLSKATIIGSTTARYLDALGRRSEVDMSRYQGPDHTHWSRNSGGVSTCTHIALPGCSHSDEICEDHVGQASSAEGSDDRVVDVVDC